MRRVFSVLLAAGLSASAASPGLAKPINPAAGGPVSCEPVNVKATYDEVLTSALSCQNGVAQNDSPLPGAVNAEAFFGQSDWLFLAKYDGSQPEGQDVDLSVTGFGELNGTWSVGAGTLALFDDFMVVLKAGTEFAGFFFDDTATAGGTWGYDAPPGLSHLTVYARGQASTTREVAPSGDGNTDVPEPGTLGLLALGILATASGRRKFGRR